MVNAKHVCACSGNSFNCGWVWVASAPSAPLPSNEASSALAAAIAAQGHPPAAPDYQAIMAWRLAREQRQLQEDLTRQQLGLPTRGEIAAQRREEKEARAEDKRREKAEKKLAKQLRKQRSSEQ